MWTNAHRLWIAALVCCACATWATTTAASELRVYRAQHRPVAELVPLVEVALAGQGRVVVDTRTAALVMSGDLAALDRALALLASVDRPLRTVLLDYTVERESAFDAAAVDLTWTVSGAGALIGTLPHSPATFSLGLSASRDRSQSRFRGSLRLLEGTAGYIVTGEERLSPQANSPGGPASSVAESGFEVTPSVLEGGRVHLELRAFAGRHVEGFGPAAVDYTSAATTIEVLSGHSVVIGSVENESEARAADLTGAARETSQDETVLLIGVVVED